MLYICWHLLIASLADVFPGIMALNISDIHDDETEIRHHFYTIFVVQRLAIVEPLHFEILVVNWHECALEMSGVAILQIGVTLKI